MSTRPCPHCHEIIPADLDYCPYCNESTRESIQTADDIALQERHAAVSANVASAPFDSIAEDRVAAPPPIPAVERCIMCNMAPATVGEYCLDCRKKLDIGPEQWDLIKQDANRQKMIVGIVVAIILIALIVAAVHAVRSRHAHAAAPVGAGQPSNL